MSSPELEEKPDLSAVSNPEKPPGKSAAIGHLAIRGIVWTIGQSLGTKCATVLQQFIIARSFLNDDDFGLLAVGQAVLSIASIGQSLGVGEILVRRHRTFDRWVDAGFWLNLTGGLLGMLLVFAIIPIWGPLFLTVSRVFGGHVTEAPKVQGLLVIWATWLPLDAMLAVMNARLRMQMRFRLIAVLASIQTIGLAVLGLALVWLGKGVYGLVISIPIMAAITLILTWALSGQRIHLRPNFHRWGGFLRDSRFFVLGNILNTLLQQGDYMLSSVFFSPALLGAYYFAYRMSTQTVQLIGANATSVLLPSFSKIDDDEVRRTLAYERICSTLLLLGMPLCFLQALLAAPGFHLVFANKWDTALLPFQIFSVAMAFTIPMTAATSFLLSQGRYRFNVTWMGIMTAGFLLSVLIGALSGSILGVACCVGGFFVVVGPITVALPVKHVGILKFLWRVFGFPTIVGALAAGVGWELSHLAPWQGIMTSLVLRTFGCITTFTLVLLTVRPPSFLELVDRARSMLGKRIAARHDA